MRVSMNLTAKGCSVSDRDKVSKTVSEEMREHYGPFIDRASLGPCHYEGCWKDHWVCAVARLLDACDRLQSVHETTTERHEDGRRKGHSPLTADNLASRIAGEPPEPAPSLVRRICNAYEHGFGQSGRGLKNPYVEASPENLAWTIGINTASRSQVKTSCSTPSTGDNASPSRSLPSSVECPKCRTQLAFEGDVCGLCNPEVQP